MKVSSITYTPCNISKNKPTPLRAPLPFLGYNVHILDGGAHGENMAHFAKAISPDMDVIIHEVETNSKSPHEKQMKSLYEQLKAIPPKTSNKNEYIALPGLCSVPLQNVEDQYERVMGDRIKLTPQNVKANKKKLNEFLKKISQNPNTYSTYTGYMDPLRQGMEWMYEVITEINRLVNDGYKVYVPSGHPEFQSLKWLAGERNRKPELQHYIATGVDKDGAVKGMRSYIQGQGWYDFNLLNLSDAHTVNLKDAKGKEDYLYAAYDGAVTDGARGVYNFYPVRDSGGKVKGYSYTDEYTVQYPYSEFPANDELAPLLKFVGKKVTEVLANSSQVQEFKKLHSSSPSSAKDKFSKVLFNTEDVFTPSEISNQKIELKGRYVDSSMKLFFDKDSAECVTFPNCNCEGSDRPSVLSMWGSCFSVFNAINDDIQLAKRKDNISISTSNTPNAINSKISGLLERGKTAEKRGFYSEAEDHYNNAIEFCKIQGIENPAPHIALGNLHFDRGKYDYASSCFNNAVDMSSKQINDIFEKSHSLDSLASLERAKNNYNSAVESQDNYKSALREYNNRGSLYKFFKNPPAKPPNEPSDYSTGKSLYDSSQKISEIFDKIGVICAKKGEDYPAKVCKAAAKEIRDCSARGTEVIKKRAEKIQYIGDIFNEIRSN